MSKILIVDDEPEVLRSLRILLESVNYHVLLANDGDEAIQILEQTGDQIYFFWRSLAEYTNFDIT